MGEHRESRGEQGRSNEGAGGSIRGAVQGRSSRSLKWLYRHRLELPS